MGISREVGGGRAATICNVGPERSSLVTSSPLLGRASVLQQECSRGIRAELHISVICWQQSFSWADMAFPEITHATIGEAVQQKARNAIATHAKRRMV
jgi:hypothetical protein